MGPSLAAVLCDALVKPTSVVSKTYGFAGGTLHDATPREGTRQLAFLALLLCCVLPLNAHSPRPAVVLPPSFILRNQEVGRLLGLPLSLSFAPVSSSRDGSFCNRRWERSTTSFPRLLLPLPPGSPPLCFHSQKFSRQEQSNGCSAPRNAKMLTPPKQRTSQPTWTGLHSVV